jgi:hypothetical protein
MYKQKRAWFFDVKSGIKFSFPIWEKVGRFVLTFHRFWLIYISWFSKNPSVSFKPKRLIVVLLDPKEQQNIFSAN